MVIYSESDVHDIMGEKHFDNAVVVQDGLPVKAMRPLLVGLTGGIGCGKTTVVNVFRKIGIPCFVADDKAGKYYDEDDFLKQLRGILGDAAFFSNGKADKKAIANIVFHDREKLLALNTLVHPRLMKEFADWASQIEAPYVIIESAVLFEYHLDEALDRIICVYLGKKECLSRLTLRDHVCREALEARMRNQLSAEEKMDRSDYVILNYEGNPRTRQVRHIDQLIRESISL